jgi:hypothetical protein
MHTKSKIAIDFIAEIFFNYFFTLQNTNQHANYQLNTENTILKER